MPQDLQEFHEMVLLEAVYEMAMMETAPRMRAERIDVAMVVLGDSLQDIGDSPEDNGRRQWIEDATRTLRMLQQTEHTVSVLH